MLVNATRKRGLFKVAPSAEAPASGRGHLADNLFGICWLVLCLWRRRIIRAGIHKTTPAIKKGFFLWRRSIRLCGVGSRMRWLIRKSSGDAPPKHYPGSGIGITSWNGIFRRSGGLAAAKPTLLTTRSITKSHWVTADERR